MNEEQLLQEARKEAENVYPDIIQRDSISDPYIRNELNNERYHLIHGYISCYIANAKKQMNQMLKFAWWVDNNYISYTEGRYIDGKNPENPTLTEKEVYDLFLQQQKQE